MSRYKHGLRAVKIYTQNYTIIVYYCYVLSRGGQEAFIMAFAGRLEVEKAQEILF